MSIERLGLIFISTHEPSATPTFAALHVFQIGGASRVLAEHLQAGR